MIARELISKENFAKLEAWMLNDLIHDAIKEMQRLLDSQVSGDSAE